MSWRRVGFLHWPVDPGVVAASVPDGLSVDTHGGRAWVGVVPFRMVDLRTRGSPLRTTFAQVNLRTYVRHRDRPGTYFFSLDAPDPAVVGLSRRLAGLPYFLAETRLREEPDGTTFGARRTHPGAPPARVVVTYRAVADAPAETPAPGSIEEFLVGRERYYVRRGGRLQVGRVEREPFRLRPGRVTVTDLTLPRAAGLDQPEGDPRVSVAAGEVAVSAGPVRPVESR